MEGQKWQIVDK